MALKFKQIMLAYYKIVFLNPYEINQLTVKVHSKKNRAEKVDIPSEL